MEQEQRTFPKLDNPITYDEVIREARNVALGKYSGVHLIAIEAASVGCKYRDERAGRINVCVIGAALHARGIVVPRDHNKNEIVGALVCAIAGHIDRNVTEKQLDEFVALFAREDHDKLRELQTVHDGASQDPTGFPLDVQHVRRMQLRELLGLEPV